MKDLYLKFPDEETARALLFQPNGDRRYVNIDVLGTLYNPPSQPGQPPVPLDGWHVNVRLVSYPEWDEERKQTVMVEEDGTPLEPYVVQVATPRRVWA